jgi:hypothetical protein
LARSDLRHFRRSVAGAQVKPRAGRGMLGRYCNYPPADWLKTAYDAAGAWQTLKSDIEDIKSFDETPATMLHLVMRKGRDG